MPGFPVSRSAGDTAQPGNRATGKLRIAIPVALLIAFLFGGWTLRNKLAADRQGEWVRATRGDLVTGIEVTGTLASEASQTLGPPPLDDVWEFKIAFLEQEGKDVKQGHPVLRFDTTELQRRLDEKSAEADEARKQIEKERADLSLGTKDERMKLAEAEARLRKATLKLEAPPDVAATKDRRETEIEYAIAKKEDAAIRSRLQSLELAAVARIALLESRQREAASIVARTTDAIRQMTVVSPRDGTVVYVTSRQGEKKKVGDSVWKMERVVEIPDLTRMKADGEVDEVDAGRVARGQRVTLRLDAHPDDEFQGTIVSTGHTVQRKRGTQDPLKVLRVDIKLDRTDAAKMRPGMRFQGTIELGRVKNAVLIPRDAIFVSPRGPFVHRRGTFDVDTIPVRLGGENDELVEVREGVDAGDRVLVARQSEEEKS
ncbi:MAG TPA: efflux RND transporter periplasmic adaptor subunit [Thermoanaerobaculia bacterium]|nr:efflux RND transporter periplasmic adaptor subunit [Thermoanaerobaculia bacterium]